MPNPDHSTTVERAQSGDAAAFGELVRRYQDLVVGTAFGWLGEIESARDVAQESFLDAHRNLHQLRDPAAFPGWLRRIVTKHCDRVTRRKHAQDRLRADEEASHESNPELLNTASEQAQLLHFAVDALPADERMVVALQYFAEATGPEVSAFLELPITTIKRRLRSARRRLRDNGEDLMAKTTNEMRPSNTGEFAKEVIFFLALRSGDCIEVKRLLDETPTLVEALQEWDKDLVHERILPFANKATPLITTIELGDLAMQTLLLDAGADVNGVCGCQTGEAPIWAATLLNRIDHAEQLLMRGANPNAVSSNGNRPLHLAAMRGLTQMTQLLLEYGADPEMRDEGAHPQAPFAPFARLGRDPVSKTPKSKASASGRTPTQWAAVNGHEHIVNLIEQSKRATQINSTPSATTPHATITGPIVHTGIKAIDLFVPILRGGVTRFPFMAGIGMVVLLGELCQRFVAMDSGKAIWTGFTQPPFDLVDWQADMAEFGLADQIGQSLVSFEKSPGERRDAFARGLNQAESLRDAGHDVLAIILSTQGFEIDIESSLMRLTSPSTTGSITSIIVTPYPEDREIWSELKAPYSGQIVLDRKRAQRHLFPAIDPQQSLARGLASPFVDARHLQLAQKAKSIILEYQERDPDFDQFGADDMSDLDMAHTLLSYLCQPFSTTEPFTGRSGEYVSHDDLMTGVARIVEA